MKIVYFSNDRLEVERISQELVLAGIACEVREGLVVKEAELWINKDSDLHRAFMRCVELSVGFAKRETHPTEPELRDEIAAA